MLAYKEILERMENPEKCGDCFSNRTPKPLVTPFDKEKLQSVSYDISASDKIVVSKTNDIKIIDLQKKDDIDSLFKEISILDNKYQLKPNEFILIQTKEEFCFPDDIAGHIRPRTTFNKLGLIITSQHINPSFEGKLSIGVKNMTNNIMLISKDLVLGQVVFEKVDINMIPKEKLYNNIDTSKYQNEDEFISSKVYSEETIKEAQRIYNELVSKL